MIVNPLDFKINTDLIFLKLGISHNAQIRSTANMNIGIHFAGILEHELELEYDNQVINEEN